MLADALHLFGAEEDLTKLRVHEGDEDAEGGGGERNCCRKPHVAGKSAQKARITVDQEAP